MTTDAGQVLPQEAVLTQLKTRGFESGGFRSPLRHFRGKMDSITGSMVKRGSMTEARLEVSYNFSEVEVFASTEPYPFPVAQVSMMHSNRVQSQMGYLGASIDKIINAGLDENLPQQQAKNQDFLIGKVQEWMVTPGHPMPSRDANGQWTEAPQECWEVVWVEGVGGTPHSGVAAPAQATTPAPVGTPAPATVTPTQRAIDLLDGKNQQQWNNVVFQDPMVKGDTALVNSIITGAFLAPLEESGVVTKDADGVYHKAV